MAARAVVAREVMTLVVTLDEAQHQEAAGLRTLLSFASVPGTVATGAPFLVDGCRCRPPWGFMREPGDGWR